MHTMIAEPFFFHTWGEERSARRKEEAHGLSLVVLSLNSHLFELSLLGGLVTLL
jgi:hypothetical protein